MYLLTDFRDFLGWRNPLLWIENSKQKSALQLALETSKVPKDDEEILDGETFQIDTYTTTNESYYATFTKIPELMEFYLNLPGLDVITANPTTITTNDHPH